MATTIKFSAHCEDKTFEPITFEVPFEYTQELWEVLRKSMPALLTLMNGNSTTDMGAKVSVGCDMEVTRGDS